MIMSKNKVKHNPCIIKECTNKDTDGDFINNICIPCYIMLITGKINKGTTFIHKLNNKLKKLEEELIELHNL